MRIQHSSHVFRVVQGLTVGAAACCAMFCASAWAQSPAAKPVLSDWQFGAVLDGAYQSETVPLGLREKGASLGHSDLTARGTLGRHLSAEAVAVVSVHEGQVEKGIEKLFMQTRSLPAGFQVRLGRFASQVGYLNEQHPHADDFVERPALYRAFLGHHYFDDGIRLNWTAPTPFYLQLGAESFGGRKLSPESTAGVRAGVSTLSAKLGSDIGTNQAWQAGAALLLNRRASAAAHDEAAAGHLLAAGVHMDEHGATFTGSRLSLFDLAWKWAPNGNPREQQWRVVLEHARLNGLPEAVVAGQRHEGSTLAVVWRFRPDWEAGLRLDRLRAAFAHEDHFDPARLNERSAMLVYKPSHKQALRLQWTTHRSTQGFEVPGRSIMSLQYVVAFGAHGAHNF